MKRREVEEALKGIQAGAKLRLCFRKECPRDMATLYAMTDFGGLAIEIPMAREVLFDIAFSGKWGPDSNRTVEVVVKEEFFGLQSPESSNLEWFTEALSYALEKLEVVGRDSLSLGSSVP